MTIKKNKERQEARKIKESFPKPGRPKDEEEGTGDKGPGKGVAIGEITQPFESGRGSKSKKGGTGQFKKAA